MPSARASVLFRTADVDWMFTLGLGNASGAFASAGAVVNSAIVTNILPVLSSDTTFQGTRMGDVVNQTTPGVMVKAPPDSVGGWGALALPQVCCLSCTTYYDSYGRGRHGRITIAGMPKDQQAGGLMLDSYVDQVQTACEALRGALTAGGFPWHVVATRPKLTRGGGTTDLEVTAVIVRDVIRENRRREFGRSITGMHRA